MDTIETSRARAEGVTLTITGMTCSGCANTVRRLLSRLPGVDRAEVDFKTRRATVTGTARPEDLVEAVRAAGYGAELSQNDVGERNEPRRSGCC